MTIYNEAMVVNENRYIVINKDHKYAGRRGTLKEKFVNKIPGRMPINMCSLLLDDKEDQTPILEIFESNDLMNLAWINNRPILPDRYQELAVAVSGQWKFQNALKDRIVYNTMSLAGEAGECIELVKKCFFQQNRQELNEQEIEKLKLEIGDIFWFAAALGDALGLQFDNIMKENLIKLHRRYPNGFTIEESINRKI